MPSVLNLSTLNFTINDVFKVIYVSKANKKCGPDNLSPRVQKSWHHHYHVFLTEA